MSVILSVLCDVLFDNMIKQCALYICIASTESLAMSKNVVLPFCGNDQNLSEWIMTEPMSVFEQIVPDVNLNVQPFCTAVCVYRM